ncbi:hypothetical protein, partial [Leptospira noguchii]
SKKEDLLVKFLYKNRCFTVVTKIKNRIVEKLILYPFAFHGNGQLKQFCRFELWNFSITLIYFYTSS